MSIRVLNGFFYDLVSAIYGYGLTPWNRSTANESLDAPKGAEGGSAR
jgi:hypothetical protein